MKAAPTLDGRFRIDAENDMDHWVLRHIILDAKLGDIDLAGHFSGQMDSTMYSDWEEFVLPDLRNGFDSQLARIAKDLQAIEQGDPIFIDKESAEKWYGGLNQARLVLESHYQFSGLDEDDEPANEIHSAYLRSNFYATIQTLLLEFLM